MYDPLIVDKFVEVHSRIQLVVGESQRPTKGLSAITRGRNTPDSEPTGARLDEISASREEMLVLYELARGLSGHLDLGDAADVISKHLRRIVPASTCVFYVYDADADELVAAHASGEHASHFSNLRIPRGQRLSGWVAANRQTIVNSDPVLDLGEVARVVKPRLRSCLSTPLVSEDDLVGVLTVYSTHRDAFTEDHRRISEVVGRQVSRIVKQAVAFQTDRTRNLRDHLTGLPNVQHLERFVAAELAADAPSAPLSLILVDLDSLKSINRKHGRTTGDQALGLVADAIRKVLRGADILFRYTSDEFVVLLTQTDVEAAEGVARRIADTVSGEPLVLPQEEVHVSVTLGVACAPADGSTVDALVRAASGRGRAIPRDTRPRPSSIH
jgi:diguanylate cyclase (GGDEF)-like protein